jgi:hypothetical protein
VLTTQTGNVRTAALVGASLVGGALLHIGGMAPNVGKGLMAAGLGIGAVQVAQNNAASMPTWLQLGAGTGVTCPTGTEKRCLTPCATGSRLLDGTCGTPGTGQQAVAPAGYVGRPGYAAQGGMGRR